MLPLNQSIDLKSSILLKEDFKGPTNMDISTYLAFNRRIWFGASYRTAIPLWNKKSLERGLHKSDAVAALLQFYPNDRFRIGYSFDFNTNKLSTYQNGTHEISISLSLRSKGERVLSPRFF
jgi:type IX secretion system PorP/SprF family membrane protein